MEIKYGVQSDAVNQRASHVLFVEGSGDDAIDPLILTRLLADTGITVKAMGASYHLKSTAQALHPHHPNYYFVIDRDHHDDATVTSSWNDFPNPSKHNLLIWQKRELENYFLLPEHLAQSTFLTKTQTDMESRLLKICEARIFFDLANQTIATIREEQKAKWIEEFPNPALFKSSKQALAQLKSSQPLITRTKSVAEKLKIERIEEIFTDLETLFLEGEKKPKLGKGKWIDKMRGKPILSALVTECFTVRDKDDKLLTGRDAVNLVAMELLSRGLEQQPQDFQKLHKLITECLDDRK